MATGRSPAKDFPTVVPQSLVTASRKITHVSVWTAAARGAGNLRAVIDITDSETVKLGQTVKLPAGFITLTVPTPTGGGLAAMATDGIRGMIGTALYVDAHYAAPGAAGTASRLSEIGQVSMPVGEWAIAA